MFAVSAFTRRNFAHETGICLAGVSRAGLQCYCRAGWRAASFFRCTHMVKDDLQLSRFVG